MSSSSPVLILSLQLLAHIRSSSANPGKFGNLDINDYLLGASGDYRDHEIFSVEEGVKEDIVYLTKRVPSPSADNCSDCDYFTPCDEDDSGTLVGRSALESVENGLNTTQSVTVLRRESNIKSKKIECAGGEIFLESYSYPTNEQLAKLTSNKIYDFKPFDRPDQASYYQLQKNKRISASRRQGFIESEKDRCKHIVQNFKKKVEIDTVWNIKDSSSKPATEAVKKKEAQAIDWVAHQYPAYNKEKNPFASEFVSLHDGVNGRKERLWSEASTGSKKGPGAAKKPDLVDGAKWKKWTTGNRYLAISPSKTGSKRPSKSWTLSTSNEGKCHAVVALRDIIGVYRYHSLPEVQDVLTAQINRIGTAFEYLEQGPLKGGYVPMATSLESQWNAYIKAKYASVIADIESNMKTLSADLEKARVKRSWLKRLKRGAGSTWGPLCGQEKDKKKMNDRITLLLKEYEAVKGKWKNPMP